jgi:hypothetical protein
MNLVLARGTSRKTDSVWLLRDSIAAFRLARAMVHEYDVLSNLSNSELAARGIERQDIPRIVVNRRYKF